MSIGKIIALIFGIIFLLIGIMVTVSGIAVYAVSDIYTDNDGFFTSPQFQLEDNESVAYTLSDIKVNLGKMGPQFLQNDLGPIATVRISLSSPQTYFIGVAPSQDANNYLSNVRYSDIKNVKWMNGVEVSSDTENPSASGNLTSLKPQDQTFWDTSASGNQVFEWVPKDGSWTIIILKADGTSGIDVNITAGVKVPALRAAATILIIIGVMFVLLALAIFIILATTNKKKIVRVDHFNPANRAQVSEISVPPIINQPQIHGTPSPKLQSGTSQAMGEPVPTSSTNEEVYVVAEWGQRILAYIIDIIIVSIFVEMIRLPVIISDPSNQLVLYPAGVSVNGVVLFIYFTLLEYNYGTTIGKQALHLRVITEDGRTPEIKEVAISSLGKAFFLPIDLLIGLFIKDESYGVSMNQRLMQKVSKTLVIQQS